MKRSLVATIPGLGLALLAGCEPTELPPPTSGPLSLKVELKSPPEGDATFASVGSAEAPLPAMISEQSGAVTWPQRTYDVDVTAIGRDGLPDLTFNGTGRISVVPGAVVGDATVPIVNGKARVSATVVRQFGTSRIWIEDVGTTEKPGSYATGLMQPIHVKPMTLPFLQTSDPDFICQNPNGEAMERTECNAFAGNYVDLDTSGGGLVVTQLTTDGFYAMDTTANNGAFNGLFVYVHSAPVGLYVGDVLKDLGGIVAEFNGSTQLSFPVWEVSIGAHPVREATFTTLTAEYLCDSANKVAIEGYEGALVSVEGAKVGLMTVSAQSDYAQYGQWPVALTDKGCSVLVGDSASIPSFDPFASQGKALTVFRGSLTSYEDKYGKTYHWQIIPGGPEDLVVAQ